MKIYGPYTRPDGRKHVVIEHADGRKTTKSWPKILLERKLGRELAADETTDHIDDDFRNDDPDNLQPLSFADNARKGMRLRAKTVMVVVCKHCKKEFERDARTERRRIKDNKDGPFCSKHCVGKTHNN